MPTEHPPPLDDLSAYLDWLQNVWLPSIVGAPSPRPPKLTLIPGGRDDA